MNISIEQLNSYVGELYIANKLLEEQIKVLLKENKELKIKTKGVKEDADN